MCLYFTFPVHADSVTNFSDTVSTHLTSTAANHTIQFTTPGGVGAGETVVLAFSDSFTIGSVDYTDIDVADDGIDLTLGAAPAGATWGASFSGNTLTITSGTGTIAAASVISIQIGTNATSGAAGDRQITNPASSGSYTINLSGTFGDTGEVAVPITTGEGAAVTASIDTGGGTTGGDDDNTPPIISNIQVINITVNSATITWDTNEASTSIVKYGLTESYELPDESSYLFVTSHSISLEGLDPGTLYNFQVGSIDDAGNAAYSENHNFTTAIIEGDYLYMRAIPEKRLPSEGNNSAVIHVRGYRSGTSNKIIDELITTNNYGYDTSISLEEISLPLDVDFLIKGNAHLQYRKNNITLTENSDLVDFSQDKTVKLKAGDVNDTFGDNYVNGADLSVISTKLYASGGRVDLNKDTTVNGLEFAISITNLYNWGDF